MDRRFSAFTLSAFCFLVICVSALAQNAPVDPTLEAPSRAAEDTDVPEKLRDEAFDKHVDIRLLGPAIEDGDAGLLVDLALQTAHGEKVMQRKRKGIAAADIFTIAMRAAAASRDKAALKRIAQYAEKHQDAALKAKTTAALKLAGSSRSVKPDTTVSVEDVDAEKFAAYKALLNQIQLARIVGNRSWLVAMKDSLPEDYFHKGQRDFAVKAIDDALEALPEEGGDSEKQGALLTLAGTSRIGLSDFDPFNKNSAVRRAGRDLDRARLDPVSRYSVLIGNPKSNGSAVTYKFRGKPEWLPSGIVRRHYGRGVPTIRFNNGYGQPVSYRLGRYNAYNFRRKGRLWGLYKAPRVRK